MMRWWHILVVVACLAGAWNWWSTERNVLQPPGIIAPDEPAQTNLDPPETFEAKGYTFIKRARFDFTARLLRKERYRIDAAAAFAPYDLGVGWGDLSDNAVIEQLTFAQMGRYFYAQPKSASFPLSPAELNQHLAQVHAIPANDAVAAQLARLRPSALITAHGFPVDVSGGGEAVWKTSMTRDDTGDNACEMMWVESLVSD